MKKYYRDFYGCTASISKVRDGYKLRVCEGHGKLFHKGIYRTERGAKIALGKTGDCWEECTTG